MIEKKTEVVPFLIELYCDQCDVMMEDTEEVILTNPMQYSYICPNCNKKVTSDNNYPRIIYEKKNKD